MLTPLERARAALDAGDDAAALRHAQAADLLGAPPGGADLVRAVVQARHGQRDAARRALDAAWEASRAAEAEPGLRGAVVRTAVALGEGGRALAVALELLAETDDPAALIHAAEVLGGRPGAEGDAQARDALVAHLQFFLWWQGRTVAAAPLGSGPAFAAAELPHILAAHGAGLTQAAAAVLAQPGPHPPPPAVLLHLAVAAPLLQWLGAQGLVDLAGVPATFDHAAAEALCAAAWRGGLADPVQQFSQCGRLLPRAPALAEASLVCAWLAGQGLTAARLVAADPGLEPFAHATRT